MESVEEHFLRHVAGLRPSAVAHTLTASEIERLITLFDAQALSRHTDLTARELQARGEAFYTIGSAGHEANAAVALALRPTDPALLHYRSGGFYAARATQVHGISAAEDILGGAMSSTADGISGGRHKVFGSVPLGIIPQTSTIASHLPRAFGLAFALDHPARRGSGSVGEGVWPEDAVVVCSLGDASLNHSSAQGALNAAAYCTHRSIRLPLLIVCEDNGIGISTRSPEGWIEGRLRAVPGVAYTRATGSSPRELLQATTEVADAVRRERRPAILHLETVRFMGHAGSDAEIGYRSVREIEADYARDPLLATAIALVDAGVLTAGEIIERYARSRDHVRAAAARVPRRYLDSAAAVMAPLLEQRPDAVSAVAAEAAPDRDTLFRGRLPEDGEPLTLAQSINAALTDVMAAHPQTLVLGQDVARKGGVYGVTRGLLKTFGAARIFDTILDEQTILGTALGSALAGFVPIPEIQYLAYLHNAEDQLRGEAATLRFFSAGQFQNPMVVRIAGLGYQRGFGGHFHNDNSLAVLRDLPGVVLAVPSHPVSAPGLLRECVALAHAEGRVAVLVEPIALYHQRDVLDQDGGWLALYASPATWPDDRSWELGRTRTHREGADLLVLTFGNGIRMSLRVAAGLADEGIETEVADLQWLAPLPVAEISARAVRHDRVLVVDETRRSGGVSEAVLTALVDAGFRGRMRRVTSHDSFIPLGPAAERVLLSEDEIRTAALDLMRDPPP